MNLNIPEHLRSLTILNQLYLLTEEYSSNKSWKKDVIDSYNADYSTMDDNCLSYDPVKKFIAYLLKNKPDAIREELGNETEDLENYLVKLFYSVKGTPLVCKYAVDILGFSNVEISSELKLTIDSPYNDEAEEKLYKEFFSALLYYTSTESTGSPTTLNFNVETSSTVETTTNGEPNSFTFTNIKFISQ